MSMLNAGIVVFLVQVAGVAQAAPEKLSVPATPPAAKPPAAAPLEEVMRGLDQTGTPALPPPSAPPPASTLPAGGKRPVPVYGVRADDQGDGLLWVPRTVFFPAYAVAEYGLRRPMVGLVTVTEEHYVVPRLMRLFTWDDGKAGLFPTVGINAGFRPTVGFLAFDDELGSPDSDLQLGGNIARSDVYALSGRLRHRLLADHRGLIAATASYASRDDQVFYGLGGATTEADRVYYARQRLDVSLGFDRQIAGYSRVLTTARLRKASFGGSDYRGADRGIESHYGGARQDPLPAGFSDGYTVVGAGTRLVLDSRRPTLLRPAGSGVRFMADGALTTTVAGESARFADWGGEVAGFVDASGLGHVLSLRAAAHFQETLSGQIPFDEQFGLAQFTGMRGFIDGRLRGDSAVLLEAQYRYPIATLVDAELFSGLSNAFAGHLDGFGPRRLYWDYGLSLRTYTARDSWWGVTLAFGSNRLDSPSFAAADFVRFSAGFNQGF
jgi:hypothetical protein